MRRVHVLPCGYQEDDKGVLTSMKDCGTIIKVPYHAYLIEDPECTIIVDTGVSLRWRELHSRTMRESFPVHIQEHEHLDKMLESVGFSTTDVDYVINTHLHYDHCGNNGMFPRAQFVVNETELAHAFVPGWWEADSYVRALFDIPGLKYELVRGSAEIAQGIRIVSTPGHSEGHQSVAVQLEKTRLLVIAGDAIFLRENLEGPILPGLYVDARKYAQSMVRLKRLIEMHKGTMLLSHSREYLSWDNWKRMEEGVVVFT